MHMTPENYLLLALQNYQGNISCGDKEFDEDIKRLHYIKRLLKRYERTNEVPVRLLLNHFVILYNTFGSHATYMLWFRMPELTSYLKPFMETIGRLPPSIHLNGEYIDTSLIVSDEGLEQLLKGI